MTATLNGRTGDLLDAPAIRVHCATLRVTITRGDVFYLPGQRLRMLIALPVTRSGGGPTGRVVLFSLS